MGVSWEGLVKYFLREHVGLVKSYCRVKYLWGEWDWSNFFEGVGRFGQMFCSLQSRWNWSNFLWEQMGLVKPFEVVGGIGQMFLWKFLCCSNFFVVLAWIGQTSCGSGQNWSKL